MPTLCARDLFILKETVPLPSFVLGPWAKKES
jgi:hypothetical protein